MKPNDLKKIFDMIDLFYANKHLYIKIKKAQRKGKNND